VSDYKIGEHVRILDLPSVKPGDRGLEGRVVRIEGDNVIVCADLFGRATEWPRAPAQLERVNDDPRVSMRTAIEKNAEALFNVRANLFWDQRLQHPDQDPVGDWEEFLAFERVIRDSIAEEMVLHLKVFDAAFSDAFVMSDPAGARLRFAEERDQWLLSYREGVNEKAVEPSLLFAEYAKACAPAVERRERARLAYEALHR
jgi:hypothetical protein